MQNSGLRYWLLLLLVFLISGCAGVQQTRIYLSFVDESGINAVCNTAQIDEWQINISTPNYIAGCCISGPSACKVYVLKDKDATDVSGTLIHEIGHCLEHNPHEGEK